MDAFLSPSLAISLPALARGLVHTLELAVVCLVASLLLGLVFGVMRYAGGRVLHALAIAYVEVFRNTPVLVQILWFFFALPILVQFEISAFTAAALGLSLNSGAFSAEIFRAGMQAVPKGQWEAANALGMSRTRVMFRIVLPQAVRHMIPAFTNRWIELFKLTSLASVIAYPELVYSAQQISNSYFNPVEVFTLVAVIFIALVIPASYLLRRLEARLRRSAP
ncbi:amino acid ABC transporter permease [Ancylobacter sonchi]|uniref:amino acid ABC transporter permease n=1 Tax=Ancylobacter sonchi TaxID=1937790 RepID=UPI001BD1E404|nr:amino acid ABC transporter permease [Ancylobacter sonchi]MBS7532521.1 amino acid ABC transporter permease [Ancylobacter sonchi]